MGSTEKESVRNTTSADWKHTRESFPFGGRCNLHSYPDCTAGIWNNGTGSNNIDHMDGCLEDCTMKHKGSRIYGRSSETYTLETVQEVIFKTKKILSFKLIRKSIFI